VRLVLPNALSDSEKVLFERYEGALPASGVCTNVCLGAAPWDLRPLVLNKGRVWMYRFSRSFDDRTRMAILDEVQGFTVVPGWDTRVEAVPGLDQFVLIRPYFQSTLKDLLLRGELPAGEKQLPLAKMLIEQVSSLAQRRLAHGHICLSNITVVDEQVALLDPRIGLLNGSHDEYVAPEAQPDQEPQNSADLYSLGRTLKVILGEAMTGRQRQLVDQMLLPTPRQRPTLDEVRDAFLQDGARVSPSQGSYASSSAGRVVSSGRKVPSAEMGGQSSNKTGGTLLDVRMGTTARRVVLALVIVIASLVALRQLAPTGYFRLARYLPLPINHHDPSYEADWGSASPARMRRTARAAVIDLDPAAQNAIIENILDGANPQGIPADILRSGFKFGKEWLSHADQDTLLALTLAPLLPEGARDTRRLSKRAPPVILAIAGHMAPTNSSKELDEVPLYTIEELPEPVGPAFRYLREAGIERMSAPEAIGLSAIACGRVTAAALDAYFGRNSDTSEILRRMANAVPLLGENEESARQMLAALRDRGGDIGSVLGWFDIDYLARWSEVSTFDKLALLLLQLPARQLTLTQYADLLTFPEGQIRQRAAAVLVESFFKPHDADFFKLLAEEHNGLTRDQNLALVSALSLPSEKRAPFISAWFETNPVPNTVVLILLARSHADNADLLNLEAARYLRKHEWAASPDILKVMVRHPEALARSMAYSKLNPTVPEERALLQESLGKERDAALLRVVRLRLGLQAEGEPASVPATSTSIPH